MRLEDHLNRARQLWAQGESNQALEQIYCAIQLAAGGAPSIRVARETIREALKDDADFRNCYLANIECIIMDFESARHAEPGVIVGPMSSAQRNALAEKILKHLFEL